MKSKVLVSAVTLSLLLSGMLATAGVEATNGRESVGEDGDSVEDYNGTMEITNNPYSGIDWDNINSYKSAFHVHTTESDGSSTVEERIAEHEECGFDVVAITDHDTHQTTDPTWRWSDFNTTLEEDWIQEYNDMEQSAFYSELGEEGMLAIRGNEISDPAHIGSFFNDAGWESNILSRIKHAIINRLPVLPRVVFTAEDKALEYIEENDGISQFFHPSIYERSTDLYVDFLDDYDSILGQEIFSSDDGETLRNREARDLWDDLLMEGVSDGRQIYGWANTDVHDSGNEEVNGAFQLILAENHSEPGQIRESVEKGQMFWVANMATYETNERIGVEVDEIKTQTDDALIEVNVTGEYERFAWIYDGDVIAEGSELTEEEIISADAKYVRFEIHETDEDAVGQGSDIEGENALGSQSFYLIEEEEDEENIPGLTPPTLLLSIIIAVAIYKKKWEV